jgi:hypothetical protein
MGHVLYVQQSEHVLYSQNHTARTESCLREVCTFMLLVCTEYIVICVVVMYNAVQHASSKVRINSK